MADNNIAVKIKNFFSPAVTRENLISGEENQTSLGKIAKWLTDLKPVAFSGSYNDLSDKPTIPTAAVTGVKGSNESSYRTGNVSLSYSNVGAAASSHSHSYVSYTYNQSLSEANKQYAVNNITPPNAGAHNSIFRGKYLGSSFTSAQKSAISNGTFDDLYVGDYWTINSINWRIVDINYFIKAGSTQVTTPHLVIMPDTGLYTAQMNTSATTSGGYYGSAMRSSNLANALTTIQNAFGSSYILTFSNLLSNAVSSGGASGWNYYNIQICLPSFSQIYGHSPIMPVSLSHYYNEGYGNSQFRLFALAHSFIVDRDNAYWLIDVCSDSYFASVGNRGFPDKRSADVTTVKVRPFFLLKGA